MWRVVAQNCTKMCVTSISVVNASTEFDPIGTKYITKPAGTFLNESWVSCEWTMMLKWSQFLKYRKNLTSYCLSVGIPPFCCCLHVIHSFYLFSNNYALPVIYVLISESNSTYYFYILQNKLVDEIIRFKLLLCGIVPHLSFRGRRGLLEGV